MTLLTLLIIGLICLIFKATRLIGIVGLTLFSLAFPLVFITLLMAGGIILFIRYKLNRRNLNVYTQPKLPS